MNWSKLEPESERDNSIIAALIQTDIDNLKQALSHKISGKHRASIERTIVKLTAKSESLKTKIQIEE